MNKFEDIRNKKIFEVLVIIKVIYILLCVVAMIGYKSTNTNKSYYIYILCGYLKINIMESIKI